MVWCIVYHKYIITGAGGGVGVGTEIVGAELGPSRKEARWQRRVHDVWREESVLETNETGVNRRSRRCLVWENLGMRELLGNAGERETRTNPQVMRYNNAYLYGILVVLASG